MLLKVGAFLAKGNYGVNSLNSNSDIPSSEKSSNMNIGANGKMMRGQIEPIMKIETMGDVWALTDDDIRRININATQEIQRETGMNHAESEDARKAMVDYLGGDYEAYRTGTKQEYIEKIDRTLSLMSAYNGVIYRGNHFFNDREYNDFLDKIKNTRVFDMGGSVSSWSSELKVAKRYSDYDDTAHSVIFVCKDNTASVGVQHISKFGKAESEVLAPSGVKWKVKSITTKVSESGWNKTIIEVSQEEYKYKK